MVRTQKQEYKAHDPEYKRYTYRLEPPYQHFKRGGGG